MEVFELARAIAWKPGTRTPTTGHLEFGGWIWRYDLEATDLRVTVVTLTYDWSAVGAQVREHLSFPPFPDDHLANSLRHLADLLAHHDDAVPDTSASAIARRDRADPSPS